MFQNQYLIYAYLLGLSFFISVLLTLVVRRAALRFGIMDQPAARKMHASPIPLMGGVAIVFTFYLVILGHLAGMLLLSQVGLRWLEENLLAFLGEDHKVKLAGILAGGVIIFIVGVVDDLKALTPWVKLAGQIAAALLLVSCGIRIELFIQAPWVSILITIAWVVVMTNSLNLLDNMDGLCGGVSVIAAFSFFLAVQDFDQQLVRLMLLIFAGSVAGFLYHNLSPARIFMGDAGALFNGYMLATMAIVGTFHVEGTPSRIAVVAPLVALSVPLFDTLSVIYIRWRSGVPIMRGDKRHFSHRLVDLGMTPRQAVEFIFLVAGVVGLGGALLPVVNSTGTFIILAQTSGVFLLIVLLMNAGRKKQGDDAS